ncbi:hypothetical protein [Microbacterium sp. Root180]|uniref:hypothetical protein n=1 Tax=Microbacterium sp. Root180 TaxID=1736483 RepID=UPI0007004F9F|nr:hypothetical protein [Microbacterium sp. Root180]KRB36411.1 hypothetical protein ASD93_10060 [Microbacterium sp. Root180]
MAATAAAADQRGYIIVSQSAAQEVGNATFYPTGPISDDTLVVIRDSSGALPNGLTVESLDSLVAAEHAGLTHDDSIEFNASDANAQTSSVVAAVGETYRAWSATNSGWSQGFTGNTMIGFTDDVRAGYYFYTAAGYNQRASGNGLGYYKGYNGSVFGTWSKWYYVGIASSTGAGASVPWGKVAAVERFRALCTQTQTCWGKFI